MHAQQLRARGKAVICSIHRCGVSNSFFVRDVAGCRLTLDSTFDVQRAAMDAASGRSAEADVGRRCAGYWGQVSCCVGCALRMTRARAAETSRLCPPVKAHRSAEGVPFTLQMKSQPPRSLSMPQLASLLLEQVVCNKTLGIFRNGHFVLEGETRCNDEAVGKRSYDVDTRRSVLEYFETGKLYRV